MGEVPGALASPFKAFGRWSLYMEKQSSRPEFKRVWEWSCTQQVVVSALRVAIRALFVNGNKMLDMPMLAAEG